MTVRREQHFHNGVYFITFACYKWLSLFEVTNGYNLVYKWFDVLVQQGNHIIGYVIMPNHLHAIIAFKQHQQSINTKVGNGKRFIAYGLVDLLEQAENHSLLQILADGVSQTDKKKKKKHQVFMASFDCKECRSDKFLLQKLNYIHANPCRGKWNLAEIQEDYPHSSAGFYATGQNALYKQLSNFKALNDDLSVGR